MSRNSDMGKKYDVIVVGAGLSGLSAGIRLQMLGQKVLILEKRDFAGGFCRSVDFNGHAFEVACNDFGSKIEKMMSELGVDQKFMRVKHRVVFPKQELQIPMDVKSFWNVSYCFDLFRLYLSIKRSQDNDKLSAVTDAVSNKTFRNMVEGLIAWPLFRPVSEISIALASRSLSNDYGYEDPRVPVKGTRSMIDKMVERFKALGGVIQFNTAFESCVLTGADEKTVRMQKDGEAVEIKVSTVASSVRGWEKYPSSAKPSLSIGALLVSLKPEFKYPEGVHTMVFLPENVRVWLDDLESGSLREDFGFHCFKNYPNNAITVYFLSPRGMGNYSEEDVARIEDHILGRIDSRLPGFKASVEVLDLYSPDRYQRELGFQTAISPLLPPVGFKLPIYEDGIWYLGNATNVDGEQHAEGALRSAEVAVDYISEEQGLALAEVFMATQERVSRSNSSLLYGGVFVAIVLIALYSHDKELLTDLLSSLYQFVRQGVSTVSSVMLPGMWSLDTQLVEVDKREELFALNIR